jgi:hypothetical protein
LLGERRPFPNPMERIYASIVLKYNP